MYKHAVRKNNLRPQFDLDGDIAKIKAALADASDDVRGRANEILAQAMENARERSANLHQDVTEYVAENTLKSLGMAALTGAVISGVIVGFILRK